MAQFVAYTKREELANVTFEWNISEFEKKIKTGKVDEFVKLKNINVGETKWIFKIFPNGQANSPTNNEAVGIWCYSNNESPMTANVSFSVMENTENSSPTSMFKGEIKDATFPAITTGNYGKKNHGHGFQTFFTHQRVKKNPRFLSNGNLRVLIKMTVFGKEKTTLKPTNYNSQEIGTIEIQERLKVTKHIRDSWTDDNFSDVHIKCNGQIFYCHRMILAKRSQYFSGMLENYMMESKTRVISLDSMEVDVLKAILKFIYGGEIDNLEMNAVNLLKAAGMLLLEDLRNICEKYLLANHMKLDNVIDMVIMAENHNASHLKKAAMDMIVANSDEIVKQDGWKEKLVNSNILLIEIFEGMAANKAL